ncbi:MAG: hypothetical protein KF752_05460 [Pirellulaceae bacterium]|nr:hypothetical protein [Pirellulaceae bacterium]
MPLVNSWASVWSLSVLAESRFGAMSTAFRDKSATNTKALWILIGVLLVAGGLAVIIRFLYVQHQKRLSSHDPGRLYRELCTAHKLSRAHRRALLKLARALKLSQPGLVFLDPSVWPDADKLRELVGNRLYGVLCQVRRHIYQETSSASLTSYTD